jgi:tRNA dimethylallyltransferase
MMLSGIKAACIFGPTASGKTRLALEIAKHLPVEIISADSRQIYKYLNIGTAKPSIDELNEVKHHFIDILNPDEYFSAGVFAEEAEKCINDIYLKNKLPLVVGGTGLYIKSLFEGLFHEDDDSKEKRMKIKNELNEILSIKGKDELYELLLNFDSKSAELYSDKNPRRIIRALEHFYITGEKLSDNFGIDTFSNLEPYYISIEWDREKLYSIINQRVIQMWDGGLVEETKSIIENGYNKTLNSLNTVGYKETIDYLENNISKDRAIELIQQNTRRYAKRQITWFKKVECDCLLNVNNFNIQSLIDKLKVFYSV